MSPHPSPLLSSCDRGQPSAPGNTIPLLLSQPTPGQPGTKGPSLCELEVGVDRDPLPNQESCSGRGDKQNSLDSGARGTTDRHFFTCKKGTTIPHIPGAAPKKGTTKVGTTLWILHTLGGSARGGRVHGLQSCRHEVEVSKGRFQLCPWKSILAELPQEGRSLHAGEHASLELLGQSWAGTSKGTEIRVTVWRAGSGVTVVTIPSGLRGLKESRVCWDADFSAFRGVGHGLTRACPGMGRAGPSCSQAGR